MDKVKEAVYMATPLEDTVIRSLADALKEKNVNDAVIGDLQSSFSGEKLPSAESLLKMIGDHSKEASV